MPRFVVVALAALAAGCGPPPEAETPDVDTFCRTAPQRWACEAATQRALGAVFDTNDGCGLPAPAATAVSRPSAKGKKASLASTQPSRESPTRLALAAAA